MSGRIRYTGCTWASCRTAIAGVLELQLTIMDLVVEAAVKGDRQAALEALLIDPNVPGPDRGAKNPG